MFKYLLLLISIPAFAQTSSKDLKGRIDSINSSGTFSINVSGQNKYKTSDSHFFYNTADEGSSINVFHRVIGFTSPQNSNTLFTFSGVSPATNDVLSVKGSWSCAQLVNSATPSGSYGTFAATYNGQGWVSLVNVTANFPGTGLTVTLPSTATDFVFRVAGSFTWGCIVEVQAYASGGRRINNPF